MNDRCSPALAWASGPGKSVSLRTLKMRPSTPLQMQPYRKRTLFFLFALKLVCQCKDISPCSQLLLPGFLFPIFIVLKEDKSGILLLLLGETQTLKLASSSPWINFKHLTVIAGFCGVVEIMYSANLHCIVVKSTFPLSIYNFSQPKKDFWCQSV